jgi:hypothetical protein
MRCSSPTSVLRSCRAASTAAELRGVSPLVSGIALDRVSDSSVCVLSTYMLQYNMALSEVMMDTGKRSTIYA